MSSSSNNEKVIYLIWTDGKGSFAVRKKEKEYEEKVSQFEYSDSKEPEKYSKLIDSKMCYDGSITGRSLPRRNIFVLIESTITTNQ